MSSTKKRKLKPCFEFDEDGKIKLLPLEIPPEFQVKERNERKLIQRPKIPLEKLNLKQPEVEGSAERIKIRKVEKSVRKELFKIPRNVRTSKLHISNPAPSRNSFSTRKTHQRSFQDIQPTFESDNEIGLRKLSLRSRPFKFTTPKKPVINFIKQNKEAIKFGSIANHNKEFAQQPTTMDSSPDTDQEFLRLEKSCATPKAPDIILTPATPMTSVCDLLKSTNLSATEASNKSANKNDYAKLTESFKSILVEDKKEFELFKTSYERRTEKLTEILNQLESLAAHNKENIPGRRSGRLAERLNADNEKNKPKLLTSPAISKSVDLRKTALTKNFAMNVPSGTATPKMAKAIQLYNSMRNEFGTLCTPKIHNIQTPKGESKTRSLSRKLQKQCLSLQETPAPAYK